MSTAAQRRRVSQLRMAAQRLLGEPWETPEAAVRAMMCVQGQDWRGVLESIAMRTKGRSLEEVRSAFDSGRIVRSYPQRGTLHVLPAEDLGWYLKLAGQRLLSSEAKRRERLSIDADVTDAAARAAERLIGSQGPVSRDALTKAWADSGLVRERPRASYLLYFLCVKGTLVYGPVGPRGKQLLALSESWIPEPRRLEGDAAVRELVGRYLRTRGPASRRDLKWWSGLPLRDLDAAVEEMREGLAHIDVDGERYWYEEELAERAESLPAARSLLALPAFDELILAYGSRWMTVPEEHDGKLAPGNRGIFRNSLVMGGRAVGFWRRGPKRPEVELFVEGSPTLARRLDKAFGRLPT